MRKIVVAVLALSFSFAALADEHVDHLRMMMAAMSSHGPVIPQPFSITADAVQMINITARSFSFNPSNFTVNQGDVVTITLSVPSNDASSIGHGILMDTYIESGLSVARGKSGTTTFTATTAGNFAFVCTQPSCGSGHSNMFGTMIVNAVAALSVADVSPTTGPITGGTQITITGAGFDNSATVTVGDVTATNVTVMNSSTIMATTPPHALGAVDVTVTVGSNTATKSSFTYFVPTPGKRRRSAKH